MAHVNGPHTLVDHSIGFASVSYIIWMMTSGDVTSKEDLRLSDEDEILRRKQRDLVDQIYSGALNPAGYRDMLRSWDEHFEALGASDPDAHHSDFGWTEEWIGHFERAGEVFEQLADAKDPPIEARLAAMPNAAMLVDLKGQVRLVNAATQAALGDVVGAPVAELDFDPHAQATIRTLLAEIATGAAREAAPPSALLRFFADAQGEPIIFVAEPVSDRASGASYLLISSANAAWNPAVEAALQHTFGLTAAETTLVTRLYQGRSIKEISADTGRSEATLRTQLSSVLGKIGVKSQAGLARVVAGLIPLLDRQVRGQPGRRSGAGQGAPERQRRSVLSVTGDVSIELVESGDLDGAPIFFVQTTTWPTWPAANVAAFAAARVRVISPMRSGLGQTTKVPLSYAPADWARHYVEVIDQLGLKTLRVGGMCSGGVIALELAKLLGPRCKAVLMLDTGAPLKNAGMINRMPLAPRRLFLGARFFPLALKTPYKLATADFYSGPEGEARGVAYFVEGSPVDTAMVTANPVLWQIVRDNFDYCVRNPQASARDVVAWSRDTTPLLEKVLKGCPVHYLHGAENLVHAPDSIEALADVYEQVTCRIVPKQSQLLAYDCPQILAEEMAALSAG